MTETAVSQVRSFNRPVTHSVTARSTIATWPGTDRWGRLACSETAAAARRIPRRRSLEAAELVSVEENENDRRVRTVRLTPAGLAERDLLERRSDELARSFPSR
jgi:hypothetical protein